MNPKSLLTAVLAAFWLIPSAGAQTKTTDPDAIVKSLYKAHTLEEGPFNQTKDRTLVDKYFHKNLADLIWKDAVTANGEAGALDFDPLYGSQELLINHFTIEETRGGGDQKSGGEDEAVVQVTFRNAGKPEMVSYQFEPDKSKAWKIRDIRYTDGRLLSEILGGSSRPADSSQASERNAQSSPYQLFDKTTSPDGRYALAWGIEDVADLEKNIRGGAEIDEEKVENYVVDVPAKKIVTTLADANVWIDPAQGDNPRSLQLVAEWGTSSDLVVVNHEGKRGNIFLRAIRLKNGKVTGSFDFHERLEKEVRTYLARKHAAQYKRSKEFLVLFVSDLKAEGENSFSLTAAADVSKNADEDANIDADMRVRFFIEGESDALKFTLLAIDKAPAR